MNTMLNPINLSKQKQLAFLEAGYKKFSKQLSGRERDKLKKQIKTLRRKIKRETNSAH